MKYVIKKNSVTWTYKGEKVLVEACGTESIRVRASFCNEIVDENYNLGLIIQRIKMFMNFVMNIYLEINT